MIMQSIANSITTNNPECHLMVVLVDERPEEVTDFAARGQGRGHRLDLRPAGRATTPRSPSWRSSAPSGWSSSATTSSYCSTGITRLGRAYNLAAPASGRILSGGVDSSALYPPKKFFGAARNIEDGGSLTILATALDRDRLEDGRGDLRGVQGHRQHGAAAAPRVRRQAASSRPSTSSPSGTRREELLMSKEELAIVWKLRRVLSALEGQQALELLLEQAQEDPDQHRVPDAGAEDHSVAGRHATDRQLTPRR